MTKVNFREYIDCSDYTKKKLEHLHRKPKESSHAFKL